MTVRAFPFDGVFVHEEDYLALQSAQRGGGIVGDPSLYSDPSVEHLSGVVRYSNHLDLAAALHVAPGAGRSVDVNIGRAMAPGFMFENDAVANLAVAVNSTGGIREDWVVARFDFANNTGELDVLVGTSPTRAFPVWEVPLFLLRVPDGFATLADVDCFDRRRYVGDRSPLRGFGAGAGQSRYYPAGYLGHMTETMIAAQTAYFMPFVVGQDIGLSKVSVVTGFAAPSGSLRLCLYRAGAGGRGMPDDAIADLGTLPLTTPDTVYEVGVSNVRLPNPQVYYIALASLTGAAVGPVRCGYVALESSGGALAEAPIHLGGVSLAAVTTADLSFAAYRHDGLAGSFPDPVTVTNLDTTGVSPIAFLSGA